MTDAPVIEVDGICTAFGTHRVHDGVSFSVARGTLVALIGGSGTGKSVLLRELIGLHRPTAGQVRVLGTDMWAATPDQLDAVRKRFGMMFQDGALFSSLTVAQNVATPLREHTRLQPDTIAALVRLRLQQAGLPLDAGDKLPSELSGGMRKRAAIARAIALEPEILFLDEPTSGLDPITARGFDRLVRSLVDDLGITVFMVTHDMLVAHGHLRAGEWLLVTGVSSGVGVAVLDDVGSKGRVEAGDACEQWGRGGVDVGANRVDAVFHHRI